MAKFTNLVRFATLSLLLGSNLVFADQNSAVLRLATTTSTENSGLLSYILPDFEGKNNVSVQAVVVGTGRALSHARNGDVDVILTHAKEAELQLVAEGAVINRQEIMYNEFVIVGPQDDPAKIHGLTGLGDAMQKIRTAGAAFVSRGDDSGTHKKELALWAEVGVEPDGDWYIDVGQGMGKALQIANELGAYTLTDKGTWLFIRDRLRLPVHVQGAADGKNLYGAMQVNHERHANVNFEAAEKFVQWLTTDKVKQMIADYKINGEQLFYPIL